MMAPSTRRILITADAVGGVWTYATELSRASQGRGSPPVPVSGSFIVPGGTFSNCQTLRSSKPNAV